MVKRTRSPTWLIILLSAIIIFLVLLITGVKNNRLINSLQQRIVQLENQLEETTQDKEEVEQEFNRLNKRLQELTSTPSMLPSPEATQSPTVLEPENGSLQNE